MNKVLWLVLQSLATIPMLPRDAGLGLRYWKSNKQMAKWKESGATLHTIFDAIVEKNQDKKAIIFVNDNSAWTFKDIKEYSLKISNYFLSQDYKQGDVVALFMDNYPSYIAVWMGLSRIGVITALVNNGAKGKVLIHAIMKAAKSPKAVIVGTLGEGLLVKELDDANKGSEDKDKLPTTLKLFTLGKGTLPTSSLTFTNLDDLLTNPNPVDKSKTKDIIMSMKTHMLYVYTSGTEGFPKAAIIDMQRLIFLSTMVHILLDFRENDIVYTPMPLYHVAGGLVGTGQMLLFGNTMVTRDKYSASNYFPDCNAHGVTVAQYIGEMASYIYSRKPSPDDKKHKVRMMVGNGMRKMIWKDFKKRFNIKKIGEFYGSTEGNANMVNINNEVGSVGFIPWYAKSLYPIELIEYDPIEYTPKRTKSGFCVRATNQGLLVSKTNKKKQESKTGDGKDQKAVSEFVGYTDEASTSKKIIADCFEKGDAYVNSGDVLRRDPFNNYFFVDRLGDTFRWRGENIAASQIEEIISKGLGFKADETKVLVYGVKIGEMDGRAGMAVFEMTFDSFDMPKFMVIVAANLKGPHTPVFLRFTSKFPTTSTAKLTKAQFKSEGIDLDKTQSDKIMFYNAGLRKYEDLTKDKLALIISGKIKV